MTHNNWPYVRKKISGHVYGILGDKVILLLNKMEGYPKIDCGFKANKCDDAGTIKGSYACFCKKEYFTSQDK